jgi:hypothetical protein
MSITPRITQVVATYILVTLAALAWLAALTLTDVDVDHDLPNTIITGAYVFASTCTLAATILGANYVAQRRLLRAVDVRFDRVHEDTGSIPRITESLADVPTLGDAFTAVAMLSGEVQQMSHAVGGLMANYEWVAADRDRLRSALARAGKGLSHSEYYEVYKDALDDLGSIPPVEGAGGD